MPPQEPLSLKRFWLADLAVLVALSLATAIAFLATSLDLRIQAWLYDPVGPEHWPLGDSAPWRALYELGHLPALAVAVGAVGYLAVSWLRAGGYRWRPHALFLIAALALGPGLIVNGTFKSHWGRPRPRQIEQFGGSREFRPALIKGDREGGKAFPCGHSSVGFYFYAFYFLFRRSRPAAAAGFAAAATAYGSLVGFARMAAGAHFASDVLWSAYLVFGAEWALYYFIVRVPHRECAPPAPCRRPSRAVVAAASAALAALAVLSFLLATPFRAAVSAHIPRGAAPPRGITVDSAFRSVDLIVAVSNMPADIVAVDGQATGFGLPWNRLDLRHGRTDGDGTGVCHVAVGPRGLFTEWDARVRLFVSPEVNRLRIRARDGSVLVSDPAGVLPELQVELDDATLQLPAWARARAHVRRESGGLRVWTVPAGRTERNP